MPNYNIGVLPLVETVDRRGSELNRGIGNARVSQIAAAIDGASEGLVLGANLSAKIQETRRLNDPAKLAAEQLNLELRNRQIAEAIEAASLSNDLNAEFARKERVVGLDTARESLRGATLKNDVYAETGLDTAKANIGSIRASTRATNARATAIEFENTPEQQDIRTANLKSRTQINMERAASLAQVAAVGTNDVKSLQVQSKISKDILAQEQAALEIEDQIQREPDPERKQQLIKDAESARYRARQLSESLNAVQGSTATSAGLISNRDLDIQKQELTLANKQIATELRRNAVANKTSLLAAQAAQDIGAFGTPNYAAGVESLSQFGALYDASETPEERNLRSAQITSVIKDFGGADAFNTYIEEEVPRDQQKAAKQAVFKAVVASGNLDLLADEQKSIIGSGLSLENAQNPDKTYDDVLQIMQGGFSSIDDSAVKKAMRGSEYFIGASQASKNGTQGFSTRSLRVSTGDTGGGPDIAGGASEVSSQRVVQFVGEDGTTYNAPIPTNDQEESNLAVIERVAQRQQRLIGEARNAQDTSSQITSRNAQVQQEEGQGKQGKVTPFINPSSNENVLKLSASMGIVNPPKEYKDSISRLLNSTTDGSFDEGFIFTSPDEQALNSVTDSSLDLIWTHLPDSMRGKIEEKAQELNTERNSGSPLRTQRSSFGISGNITAKDVFYGRMRPAVQKTLTDQIKAIAETNRIRNAQLEEQRKARLRNASPIAQEFIKLQSE